MVLRRERRKVGANLREDGLCGTDADAIDSGLVDACEAPERSPGGLVAVAFDVLFLAGIRVSRNRCVFQVLKL